MQIIRYLNGKRLRGPLPPLVLEGDSMEQLVRAVRAHHALPLSPPTSCAILEQEVYSLGKELS